ncbi:hypothetical protein B0T24DRAFT_604904 [Lasiosphaeria ovina]|uniref:Uncharacterized protein n=1 Tax=Lasiosphaeria ovina TaxID=92902 RepID=A0AAE0NL05_9PEZI|nr:hypothetical protein B0T24DRAFT_604904 [Lasiosphaeria ovina]
MGSSPGALRCATAARVGAAASPGTRQGWSGRCLPFGTMRRSISRRLLPDLEDVDGIHRGVGQGGKEVAILSRDSRIFPHQTFSARPGTHQLIVWNSALFHPVAPSGSLLGVATKPSYLTFVISTTHHSSHFHRCPAGATKSTGQPSSFFPARLSDF